MTNQYERPMAYLMQEIKKHTRKDITKNYRETGENSQIITDQLIIAVKGSRKKLSELILNKSPEALFTLSRVLSGHNNLNYHQTKMGVSYDEGCDYCNDTKVDETAVHIMTKCPKFAKLRNETFERYYANIEDLFSNKPPGRCLNEIVSFFQKCEVLSKQPKLSKRELSPSRAWGRKRKQDTEGDQPNKKRNQG